MKTPTLIIGVMMVLCLAGCSKEGGAPAQKKAKGLVPKTAAEVMASPDYKLEHTTKGGIKCYVRPLTVEIGKSIPEDSPDQEFLHGDDKTYFYFMVPIRNGKILRGEEEGELNMTDSMELMSFVVQKDPQMQKMLKEAGKK